MQNKPVEDSSSTGTVNTYTQKLKSGAKEDLEMQNNPVEDSSSTGTVNTYIYAKTKIRC